MIFESTRLYTREMAASDLRALSRILQDPQTMYAYEHSFSDEETIEWLDGQIDRYRKDGHGLWALIHKDTDEMIGQCGLTYQDFAGESVLEIGYLLRRDCWHQGFAVEAAKATKKYAFESLDVDEVYSIIRDNNIASMNVAIRNGMTIKGRFTRHYYGMDMPHYGFSIGRAEYLAE
ncbi:MULTISPECIES: GNAT family N-acetyltransferase [Gracilibacillus]|uniref:GNAT family N-acetyltransferase n=1 Tax=Gracilibacillus TaxID=74385 RepID=UPI00082649C6|nr:MULTISPECIES: GNAT family N-acetyltransferase [Gracilibacillus]